MPVVEKTADTGIATLSGLAPGRYTIQAEFPGFDTRTLQDVRIRSGENKQVAVLPIPKLEASVNVEQDKQQAAADPRGRSFGTTLTREEIEALSDDPQLFQQQLQDMAGPGAVIRIDGFEGGALPAKAQIRSIRISRDQFAAEFHSAGGVSIEIITQPGIGPIRYFTNLRMRDDAFTGHEPVRGRRGARSATRNFGGGLNGTLIKDKSSFGLFVFGTNSYDTPNLNAVLPDRHPGRVAEAEDAARQSVRERADGLRRHARPDAAVRATTSRVSPTRTSASAATTQPERAYSNENSTHNIRVQHFGPVGRRAFSRSRLQLFIADADDDVGERGADDPRQRLLHQRRRAARRRRAFEARQLRLRSGLRARTPVVARRHRARRRVVPIRRIGQLSGHVHVRQPGRVSRQPPEQLQPADRRSEPLVQATCSSASTSRTTSARGRT